MGRILLVLLVLTSFAAVQVASAMEIHPDHHGPDDRCCAGGHAGHFPALASVSTVQIADAFRRRLAHSSRSELLTLPTTAALLIPPEPRPLNLILHFCVRFGRPGVFRPAGVHLFFSFRGEIGYGIQTFDCLLLFVD